MNLYAAVILATLVAEYLLSRVASLFNLKALKSELPAELADIYDPESYRRSQEYTKGQGPGGRGN